MGKGFCNTFFPRWCGGEHRTRLKENKHQRQQDIEAGRVRERQEKAPCGAVIPVLAGSATFATIFTTLLLYPKNQPQEQFSSSSFFSNSSRVLLDGELPKFITAAPWGFEEFGGSFYVSLFNSRIGHAHSCEANAGEQVCKSSKHYAFTTGRPKIYCPCTGRIGSITSEAMGTKITIIPEGYENYEVSIFHLSKAPGQIPVSVGAKVNAGELLGCHFSPNTFADIAIRKVGVTSCEDISMFSVMSPEIFAYYTSTLRSEQISALLGNQTRDFNCTTHPMLEGKSPFRGPEAAVNWAMLQPQQASVLSVPLPLR